LQEFEIYFISFKLILFGIFRLFWLWVNVKNNF
jgi:hypothetical protein